MTDCRHKWITGPDCVQCSRCGDTKPLPRSGVMGPVVTPDEPWYALRQARGALLLDAMVDDDGKLFGTTTVALDAIDAALAGPDLAAELASALRGVIAVADRRTDEFDRARDALAMYDAARSAPAVPTGVATTPLRERDRK